MITMVSSRLGRKPLSEESFEVLEAVGILIMTVLCDKGTLVGRSPRECIIHTSTERYGFSGPEAEIRLLIEAVGFGEKLCRYERKIQDGATLEQVHQMLCDERSPS